MKARQNDAENEDILGVGWGESHLSTTGSMKSFELKYRQTAMQILSYPISSLICISWDENSYFFSHEKLLYFLNPGTLSTHVASTAVITADLRTPEVVVDGAAQGTPKRDLQGGNMASGLQSGLKR